MGNNNSDMTEKEFAQKWRQTDSIGSLSIWENKEHPDQKVEQYLVRDNQAQFSEKLYQLRKNSPFLVNAYALRKEGYTCQMDHDAKRLFVQVIPLRLSNVEDIPYPDILHLYDSCIHGYSQLSSSAGFFSIDEDQIGINQKGRVKVWLSTRFQSFRPSGSPVAESVMVRQLLDLLSSVTDHSTCGGYPNLAWYIGSHENITFREVNDKFVQYLRRYTNGQTPQMLRCYFDHGGHNPIEKWCRTNQSYGFIGDNLRITEQLYKTKTGEVIPSSQPRPLPPQATTIPPPQILTGPRPQTFIDPLPRQTITGPPPPQIFTGSLAQQAITTRSHVIAPPVHVNIPPAPPIQQSQIVHTYTPTPQLVDFRRIELGGPEHVVVTPRVESHSVLSSPKGLISPQHRFTPPVTINQPTITVPPPTVFSHSQAPAQTLQFHPRPTLLTSPIGLQNVNTPSPSRKDNILSYPPQIVQSISYQRPPPQEITATSKIIQHFQGHPVTQHRGDFVTTSIPTGFSQPENRLQQQRVISQTIELKEGAQPPRDSQGLSNYGRAIPFSFNVEDDKRPKYDVPKFAPSDDGKSSPQFLALLNELKSGVGKGTSGDQFSNPSDASSPFKNQKLANETKPEEYKFSPGKYTSQYQPIIDPDLHNDLLKINQ